MFKKLGEVEVSIWITLAALIVLAVVLMKQKKWSTRMLVTASICIALGFVLSCIRLYRMPQGGSITAFSMLPVMFFAYLFGPVPGLFAGAVYGLLQLVQGFYAAHPAALILDYILAYTALGLAGFFPKHFWMGISAAAIGRLVFHVLSGILFFADATPEGQTAFGYSFGYNATYILPEAALCILVIILPPVKKALARLRIQTVGLKR